VFPNLAQAFGWRAAGLRRDALDGRKVSVVFYTKGAQRVAYAIVAGTALSRPGDAQATTRGGVLFQTLELEDRVVVTWRRAGHTCVLVGAGPRAELLALASWQGESTLRY
jgi:hypothetical protein